MCGCAQVCVGMCGCAQVCVGERGCARVCVGVCRYAQVCACVCDEFSEFLPENRVPTSADFNTYPIRIFHFSPMCCSQMMSFSLLSRSYCIMRTAVGPTTYCLSTVFNFGNFSSSL